MASVVEYEPLTATHCPTTYSLFSSGGIAGESSTTPLDLTYGSLRDASSQDLQSSTITSPSGRLIDSPSLIPSNDSIFAPHHLDTYHSPIIEKAKSRRRLQNRESQRRFRERREQLQKTLQKQVDSSRTEYEALFRRYTESTAEVTFLLQENDALRCEIKDLRRQRRLMLSVMKMLRGQGASSEAGETAGLLGDVMHYLGDLTDDPETPETS
ncbi:hypothetical protein F66182_9976 [Fusarium sp. NRRL 66182]|nr:hypothetical protein F66182_9976 [Fusarium sp. NRRL 66182]